MNKKSPKLRKGVISVNMLTQSFMYEGAQVRTVTFNNQPHWVAKDVCEILGFANLSETIKRLDEDEVSSTEVIDSMGRKQQTNIVTESGLYSLILGSRKTEAKAFKRWITHEVIPQIRKTGSYSMQPQFALPQNYVEALKALVSTEEEKQKLALQIEADRPLVLFAESLKVSNDSILINELAKILKQNGIEIGGTRLYKLLREEGYLMSRGEQYNMPTQRSMDLKIMEVKTGTRGGSDGTVHITRTTKITAKGQIYFVNKFKSQNQAM